MSKVVTQDRVPLGRRQKFEPGFHYLVVEGDDPGKGFDSPLPMYMDMEDPSKPGEYMYQMFSEDRMVSGHRNKTVIRCTEEAYKAHMAKNTEAAQFKQADTKPDNGDEFESVSRGGHPLVST